MGSKKITDYDRGLAKRILRIQRRLGYTQQQMATLMDVELSQYQRYIKAQAKFPIDRVVRLVEILGLSDEYVFHGRGPLYRKEKETFNLATLLETTTNMELSKVFALASKSFRKRAEADKLVDYSLDDDTIIEDTKLKDK